MSKAAAKNARRSNEIHVSAVADGEREFVLHPENNDLFVRTGKQVIAACQLGISVEVWLNELAGLFDYVRGWSLGRHDGVRACFYGPGGGKTVLFFVPASDQFDFDLADDLTELMGDLLNEFNVGMVELRQIPWQEIDRFLDPRSTTKIHGEQPKSHRTVEA